MTTMVHGVTITLLKDEQPVPIETLCKAMMDFPYKFISPKAHKFYMEFSIVQLDMSELVQHLETNGLSVILLEPSYI